MKYLKTVSMRIRVIVPIDETFYIYEFPGEGLFESTTIIQGLEFASFDSLKKELDN